MTAATLAIGDVIDGKYEIRGLLKYAGSVATYRAVMAPNLPVALKVYDPRLEAFPDVVNALAHCETVLSELPDEFVVNVSTHCRRSTSGSTRSIRRALVAHILRPMHDGQNPLPLHEKATSRLCTCDGIAHSLLPIIQKPCPNGSLQKATGGYPGILWICSHLAPAASAFSSTRSKSPTLKSM